MNTQRKSAISYFTIRQLGLITLISFIAVSCHAQDMLVFRNGDSVQVKLLELNKTEIVYKRWPGGVSDSLEVIEKKRLSKIKFQSGLVILCYPDALFNQTTYAGQRRLLIKSEPLPLAQKNTWLWAEYAITPRISAEVGYANIVIAANGFKDCTTSVSGSEWGIGIKRYLTYPDDRSKRAPKLMNGFYWKPEITVAQYSTRMYANWRLDTNGVIAATGTSAYWLNMKSWTLLNTFGYQHIFKFGLSFEAQAGLGIGKRGVSEVYTNESIPLPPNGTQYIIWDTGGYKNSFYDSECSAPEKLRLRLAYAARIKIGYLLWPRYHKK